MIQDVSHYISKDASAQWKHTFHRGDVQWYAISPEESLILHLTVPASCQPWVRCLQERIMLHNRYMDADRAFALTSRPGQLSNTTIVVCQAYFI